MGYEIDKELAGLREVLENGRFDKNISERRLRYAKVTRLAKYLHRALDRDFPVTHVRTQRATPRDVFQKLVHTDGWIDVSYRAGRAMASSMDVEAFRIQTVLLSVKSDSVIRKWKKVDAYMNHAYATAYAMAAAPKWAYIVAKYAPDQMKEAFRWKQTKRNALCYLLQKQNEAK